LHKYYNADGTDKVVEDAIVFIRDTEEGPVPNQVEREQRYRKGVADIARSEIESCLWFHFLAAHRALFRHI
jgi:hypothetical protein